MIKKILTFVLLIFCCERCTSQTALKIVGVVEDAQSGLPLSGANIIIRGTVYGTTSATNGRFEFENLMNGSYTLQITYMGYKDFYEAVRVTDGQPVFVTIRLTPVVLELQSIEIEAEHESIQNYNTIVLTENDIQQIQANDVGDVLKRISGIFVIETGGAGASKKISIRGSQPNQVVVLVDGVKINNPLTGDVDLSHVPINTIEKIEIYKGNASIEFGDGAIAGAVNILTKKENRENIVAQSRVGSLGFFQLEPYISQHHFGINYNFSFQATQEQGKYHYHYTSPTGENVSGERQNSDFKSSNLFAQIATSFKNQIISFNFQHFQSQRGIPGEIYYLTPYSRSSNTRNLITFNYALKKLTWGIEYNGHYSEFINKNSNLKPKEKQLPFGSTPEFDFQDRLDKFYSNFKFNVNLSKNISSTIGCEHDYKTFDDKNLRAPDQSPLKKTKNYSWAVYNKLLYQKKISQFNINIAPALRYDEAFLHNIDFLRLEQHWSPDVQAFLSMGTKQQIFINGHWGRAFRMPTFADLFYQEFRVQGNPQLHPEKSNNSEYGVGIKWQWGGELGLNVNFFYNTIVDKIVWRLGSFEFFRPYNTDAEIFGKEYNLYLFTAEKKFFLDLNYSNSKSLNKNENETLFDKILPYCPEHLLKASISYRFHSFNFNIQYLYTGKRYVTEANTKEMPYYDLYDLSLDYSTTLWKMDLQIQGALLNIFDNRYEIIRNMPLPGREWRFGIILKY